MPTGLAARTKRYIGATANGDGVNYKNSAWSQVVSMPTFASSFVASAAFLSQEETADWEAESSDETLSRVFAGLADEEDFDRFDGDDWDGIF